MEVGSGSHNTGGDTGGWSAPSDADPHGQTTPGAAGQPNPDLAQLAQDWITLWQSELSAMAADPELHAAWQTVMAIWAGAMSSIVRGIPANPSNERARGAAGTRKARAADAQRSTPAAPAPDPRDAEVDRLARHVAALEQRLADLERGSDLPVNPGSRSGRKPRK